MHVVRTHRDAKIAVTVEVCLETVCVRARVRARARVCVCVCMVVMLKF